MSTKNQEILDNILQIRQKPKSLDSIVTLQEFTKEYSKTYFLHDKEFEIIRHINLHLAKLCGKMATYCENIEDKRLDEFGLEKMRLFQIYCFGQVYFPIL